MCELGNVHTNSMTAKTPEQLEFKLEAASFSVGLGLLLPVPGGWWLDYPDWDIGISFVMALSTLATAKWVASVVWQRRWAWTPLAIFWTWMSVDGVYRCYWSLVRPEVMIREGQWMASLCLYALCGVIWYRLVPGLAHWWWHRVPHKKVGQPEGAAR